MGTNAWTADPHDTNPTISVSWNDTQDINRIILFFDNDHDHAMEPIQYGHCDDIMPQCVRSYRISDAKGNLIYECDANHLGVNDIRLPETITIDKLSIELSHAENAPATLFHVILK